MSTAAWGWVGMATTSRMAGSTAALAAAAAATATGATDAAAQGLPLHAPNWNGIYIGGSVGGSWLNSSPKGTSAAFVQQGYAPAFQPNTFEAVGDGHATNWLGGLQAGFNWQSGRNVFGLEG